MKKKHILVLVFTIILLFAFTYIYIQGRNLKNEISIGVPNLDSDVYKYDVLKQELENKFNVKINFIDLYNELSINDTEQDLMEDIDSLLINNEIDMLLGVPPHQLEYAIRNNNLLNITNVISNKENLHKGVVDKSRKMGSGNLYYMSPIVNHISFLFQNEKLLNEYDIIPLEKYSSWDDFLIKLNEIQKKITDAKSDKHPLALPVKNANENILFSAYDFETQAFGLDSKAFENDEFVARWKELYKVFSEIIAKYGMGLEDMENGKYPKNYIFTNNNYAFMLADSYDLEVFFNKQYNEEYNISVPVRIKMDSPIIASYISYDGSKLQNFRDSSIAINKITNQEKYCIEILNYLLSKEYALKMVENVRDYNHFSNSIFNYPTYFDKDIIAELNKRYVGKFDAHLIYDADYGSVIYNTDQTNNTELFDNVLNNGFTMVFNRRYKISNIDDSINKSLKYVEAELKQMP